MRVSFLTSTCIQLLTAFTFFESSFTPAWSQGPINYIDAANPNQGYWKLHTDHSSRNTIIRLYNNDNELVYEETMPGQYIKLTDKTVSQINETLQLVASNKLILSKVKTYSLADSYRSPETLAEELPALVPAEVSKEYARVGLSIYTLKTPRKLIVRYTNPTRRRLMVGLRDESGRLLFSEYTNNEQQSFKIDMSDLKMGKYTVSIASPYAKDNFRHTRLVTLGPDASIDIR